MRAPRVLKASRRVLSTFTRLVRFPAPLTAVADPWAGAWLANDSGDLRIFASLAVIGVCVYGAGMVTNDLADRGRDAAGRPRRPLPKGEISVGGAWIFAACLLAVAFLVGGLLGKPTIAILLLLVACIFLHNFGTKYFAWTGVVSMACCRVLNLLLGVAAMGGDIGFLAPFALGLYVGAISVLAELEDRIFSYRWLLGAGGLALVSVLLLFVDLRSAWVLLPVGLLVASLFGPVRSLLTLSDGPGKDVAGIAEVGRVVGTAVRGVILFDGALVAASGSVVPLAAFAILWVFSWGFRGSTSIA